MYHIILYWMAKWGTVSGNNIADDLEVLDVAISEKGITAFTFTVHLIKRLINKHVSEDIAQTERL